MCIQLSIATDQFQFPSDLQKKAFDFNQHVRSHWEVENKLHWRGLLDVSMNEDKDQRWAEESAKNFSLLRNMLLNLLRQFKDDRSIKRKWKMAAMDNNYIVKILFARAGSRSYG